MRLLETSIIPQDGAPRSSQVATQPSIGQPAQRLSRQRFSAVALTDRSRRCSDLVCFLRDFCRVENVVGRGILDPQRNIEPAAPSLNSMLALSKHTVIEEYGKEKAQVRWAGDSHNGVAHLGQ